MTKPVIAYTKPDPIYPGYLNVSMDDDGSVVLIVRADPGIVSGAYVCGYARDKGHPGRCTPGDEHCNNYCNMAPDKGPMVDHPGPATQTICGATAAIRLSAGAWAELKAGLTSP